MPGDHDLAALRATVDAAIASNDMRGAQVTLERLWRAQPGSSTAAFVTGRAARLGLSLPARGTVALLRSFTVEPAVPVLRAAAFANGVDLTVHVGGFNTYAQEILDPTSELNTSWAADIVILAVQARDLAPELADGATPLEAAELAEVVTRVAGELGGLMRAFRRSSDAFLIVHSLEQPTAPALGIADPWTSGQRAAVRAVNDRLAETAADLRGVSVLDYDAVRARVGLPSWHDERKWLGMKMPWKPDALVAMGEEWLRYVQPMLGRVAKALVVDLDNTIWGGVIGEDGIDGIRLGDDHPGAGFKALQKAISVLPARGVLLGICSKNNADEAMDALARHPHMLLRPDSFSSIRANWSDKAENLRSIAAELNIGLDAIAFMDDNPAEIELIRQQLPEVITIELDRPPTADDHPLLRNPFFERLGFSDEDRVRVRLYAEERERTALQEQSGTLEDYLGSLGTVVTIGVMEASDVARVAQLTQKTNQFNLTTLRYSPQQIEAAGADPDVRLFVVRAEDRFGDHGLIGVVLARIEAQSWMIDTMLLSCRVIGRQVEAAMFGVVADEARAAGAATLRGRFTATAKNVPARDVYATHGFTLVEGTADDGLWELSLASDPTDLPTWIAVRRTSLEAM